MKTILTIIMIFISFDCFALTDSQKYIINIAKIEGEKINQGNVIAAIIYQETKAGKLGRIGDDNKSFGVAQFRLNTAKEAIKKYFKHPLMSDKELNKKLINDDRFSVMVCRIYFSHLLEIFDNDLDKSILAYNVGMGNVWKHGLNHDPNDYLNKVKKIIHKIDKGEL